MKREKKASRNNHEVISASLFVSHTSTENPFRTLWYILSSSPAQKAKALVSTIEQETEWWKGYQK
jgi:hypothetical protein